MNEIAIWFNERNELAKVKCLGAHAYRMQYGLIIWMKKKVGREETERYL